VSNPIEIFKKELKSRRRRSQRRGREEKKEKTKGDAREGRDYSRCCCERDKLDDEIYVLHAKLEIFRFYVKFSLEFENIKDLSL